MAHLGGLHVKREAHPLVDPLEEEERDWDEEEQDEDEEMDEEEEEDHLTTLMNQPLHSSSSSSSTTSPLPFGSSTSPFVNPTAAIMNSASVLAASADMIGAGIKKKRIVSATACDICRKMKVKCNGSKPCDRCKKHNLTCEFHPGKRRGKAQKPRNPNKERKPRNPKQSAKEVEVRWTTHSKIEEDLKILQPSDTSLMIGGQIVGPKFCWIEEAEVSTTTSSSTTSNAAAATTTTSNAAPQPPAPTSVSAPVPNPHLNQIPRPMAVPVPLTPRTPLVEDLTELPPGWVPAPAETLTPNDITEMEMEVLEIARNVKGPPTSRRENQLVTTYAMNQFIDLSFSRLSTLLHEPIDFFRKNFSVKTPQGKLKLFSILSVFYRNEGNVPASLRFLELSSAIAKDLYDDCGSETSFYSGIGFFLLSHAFSAVNPKKARIYARQSTSLLEESTPVHEKLNVLKSVIINLNRANFGRRGKSEITALLESAETLSSTKLITARGQQNLQQPDSVGSGGQVVVANDLSIFMEILKGRHAYLFGGSLPSDLLMKASIMDAFMFIRELVLIFLPNLADATQELTERQAHIPPGSIPPNIGVFMLEILNILDEKVNKLPQDHHMREMDVYFVSSIIHRAMGNPQQAIEQARLSVQYVMKTVLDSGTSPVFRVLIPLFSNACCLVENDLVTEVEMVIPYIQRFAHRYPAAQQATETLMTLRNKALNRIRAAAEAEAAQAAAAAAAAAASTSAHPHLRFPIQNMHIYPFPASHPPPHPHPSGEGFTFPTHNREAQPGEPFGTLRVDASLCPSPIPTSPFNLEGFGEISQSFQPFSPISGFALESEIAFSPGAGFGSPAP